MTHLPEPKEPEGLAIGTIVLVSLASLVVFTAGVYWAERILDREAPVTRSADEAGDAEIGIVNQLPFAQDVRAQTIRERDLERLASFGWVDRKAGRIHVPVERAMEALVAEEHPEESPR